MAIGQFDFRPNIQIPTQAIANIPSGLATSINALSQGLATGEERGRKRADLLRKRRQQDALSQALPGLLGLEKADLSQEAAGGLQQFPGVLQAIAQSEEKSSPFTIDKKTRKLVVAPGKKLNAQESNVFLRQKQLEQSKALKERALGLAFENVKNARTSQERTTALGILKFISDPFFEATQPEAFGNLNQLTPVF